MLMFIAQMVLLGNVTAHKPTATDVAPATQPIARVDQTGEVAPAPASSEPSLSAIDGFKHTRLFELAQGKKTTSLHEMLQPEFWIDTIKELVVAALAFIPRLLVSVLFLFVFWLIYRACRRVLTGAMHRANVDPSIGDLMIALTKWTVMGFGLVIACNQIGIPIVAMLTGVSILGLAVGFAAQETLANFIAGIVIFWDKPFKVGDHLTVDGTRGEVQRITFRSTRLLNGDGEMIVFPNTYMLAHKVANHTIHPVTRITIPIAIAYSASIDQARAVLLDLVKGDDRLLPDPAPAVTVAQLAESSVNLKLAFWVADEKIVGSVTAQYNERIKNALDAARIEIPFPHVQLLVKETSALRTRTDGNGSPRPLAA